MLKTLLLVALGVLVLLFLIGVITGGPAKRAAAPKQDPPAADARDPGDLHGLARVQLPKGYSALGLDDVPGAMTGMSDAELLERHSGPRAAVFRFEKGQRMAWSGQALDPELLSIVLLNPQAPDADPLKGFSIARYYSPTGSTIPLDDPRWKTASDAQYQWRWLEMDDHFGSDHPARLAIALLDPAKHARLDLFVWRKRYSLEAALTLLRTMMGSLRITPLRDAHFGRAGTYQERMARLRDANIARFFAALRPLGVEPPPDGGTAFGPSTAAWMDDDRGALRVLRVLASVPGADKFTRDAHRRPIIPLRLQPDQYPGPTRDGLPLLDLGILYHDARTGRWHRSFLQTATSNEQFPLLPFEQAACARLDPSAVHVVMSAHYYQPYALDDARELGGFLAECDRWRHELLHGRIVEGEALPAGFGAQGK